MWPALIREGNTVGPLKHSLKCHTVCQTQGRRTGWKSGSDYPGPKVEVGPAKSLKLSLFFNVFTFF